VSVLVVLHDFAFGGKVSSQQVDLLAYTMPLSCFLGRSLAAGHIPTWNPYAMGGYPSAADPQSGWMYLPVMALFTILPCGTAMQWFIVLQPIIAGLGLYWFLRGEGLSRVASTLGGVALALAAAGSPFVVWLPFMGIVMWIPLLLATASRCLRAATWSRRLLWAALTAVAWGQLAASFLSVGIILGTAALAIYGIARTIVEIRTGHLTPRSAAWLWGAILLSLPLVNLAFFLPRLVDLPRMSISFGYGKLGGLGGTTTSAPGSGVGPGYGLNWALNLATSPGAYLGALPLVFCFAGWWFRRYRYLVAALSLLGAFSYVAALRRVATGLPAFVRSLPLADLYFHSPLRFGYGLYPAIAALGAVGFEAWRGSRSTWSRAWMLLPGTLIWGVSLYQAHAPLPSIHLLLEGAIVGAIVLAVSIRRPAVLLVVPLLLAGEIGRNDLVGQTSGARRSLTGPLLAPTVSAAAYLRPGPIVEMLRSRDDGRYASLARDLVTHRGYLTSQTPDSWGLLANQRGMLFGLEDVQGYNSVQLRRYWRFVQAVSPIPLDYNAGAFPQPPPVALNLLQVRWVVGPSNDPPLSGLTKVADEGRWSLFEWSGAPPRASVLSSWMVAPDSEQALKTIIAPGFAPGNTVILEQDPKLGPPGGVGRLGTATYRALGPQSAMVEVDAMAPSLVLVRNPFDSGWHARVDGRPAPILPADYLIQAIPVPVGHHVITLTYGDPSVGYGLAGSAATLIVLTGGAFVMRRRTGRTPERS
jgi:hypothetical protein